MNWNLSFAYPIWYLPLCLSLGTVYAAVLYYKSKDIQKFSDFPWTKFLLPSIRFLLVSLLAILLLGPVLRYFGFNQEKPIISILVDDSKSLDLTDNQAANAVSMVESLESKLSEDFNVDVVAFSNVAKFSGSRDLTFQSGETNISRALRYLSDQYVNQNLGAAILLSDGIYNAGSNPIYKSQELDVPIYTIGCGDTAVYSDLKVKSVSFNSLAYLGNRFPFRIDISADKLKGRKAKADVMLNGRLIAQKNLVISKDNYFQELDIEAEASKLGKNRVDIRLSVFDDEKNQKNNSYSFIIDVIDGKKKVAIWAESPHPDLGTIRSMLNENEKYEAEISIGEYNAVEDLDLVILHNWFGDQVQSTLFERLKKAGVPVLLITGEGFKPSIFNRGSQDIKFVANKGYNSVLPIVRNGFEYFEISDRQKEAISSWPPLNSPFGKWSGFRKSDVLLQQRIGNVSTEEPLALLSSSGDWRFGVIAGTGLWQWRLAEFERTEDIESLSDLITKMTQYLAVKNEKKLLKAYPSARQYGTGEKVTLLAELYNQSLDPIADQEINLSLNSPDGKTYKHIFTAAGTQYRLELGGLESGSYEFVAQSTVGGVLFKDNGSFEIQGQEKELVSTRADYDLLRQISANTGGAFTELNSSLTLLDIIRQNEDITSVIKEESKLTELINMKWLFWLLILLTSLEWFIRKWAGGY